MTKQNEVSTTSLSTLVNTDDLSNQFPVSARELYKALGTKKRFNSWFDSNKELFVEGVDYDGRTSKTPVQGGNGNTQYVDDYHLSIDTAKQLAMISRSENGKRVRQYFIQVEKAYNSPELMMKRGLQAANQLVEQQQLKIESLAVDAAYGKAVRKDDGCISFQEMATIIDQTGCPCGRTRLMNWMRQDDLLCESDAHRNDPEARSVTNGWLKLTKKDGYNVTVVTPKGVKYLTRKYGNTAA